MSIKKEKRILVCLFDESIGYGYGPPEDAEGFLTWFTEKINSVPEEFRKDVKIEIESCDRDEEDDRRPRMLMRYWRLQTEDEKIKEVEDREIKESKVISLELDTLAMLKAKYE
jgi:hypothetical protein